MFGYIYVAFPLMKINECHDNAIHIFINLWLNGVELMWGCDQESPHKRAVMRGFDEQTAKKNSGVPGGLRHHDAYVASR